MVSGRWFMLRSCGRDLRERERLRAAPKYRGLYCGLVRGKQKLQERSDARCPGRFVVLGAFDALVVKVCAQAPAFLQENVAELLDLMNDAWAFSCADVEPNAGTELHGRGGGETMNDALIPPNRRRERCEASKNMGKLQAHIEREQAPERGTTNSGAGRAGKHAVFSLNERHQFLNYKFCVAVGAPSAQARRFGRRIFINARFSHV